MKFHFSKMSDFVNTCKDMQEAVAKKSIERVNREANRTREQGGRMPVITSTLRGSQVAGLNGQDVGGNKDPEVVVQMAIMGFKPGDKVQFGWTADYARRVNSGFQGPDKLGRNYNQVGAFYLEFGVDQWQQINAEECAEIQRVMLS